MVTIHNNPDPSEVMRDSLEVVAAVLKVSCCWYYRGGFHFRLPADWTVSITPESAERLLVETWCELLPRDRKWARSGDRDRLRTLVRNARYDALDYAL